MLLPSSCFIRSSKEVTSLRLLTGLTAPLTALVTNLSQIAPEQVVDRIKSPERSEQTFRNLKWRSAGPAGNELSSTGSCIVFCDGKCCGSRLAGRAA